MTFSPLLGFGTPDPSDNLEPFNIHSIAYANALIVKSGPGFLLGFTIYSSKASAQFIQVHDTNTVPGDGSIPAAVFTIAATANLPIQWLPGRAFTTGCVIVNSSTGPTKTLGSADCWFDVQYL